VTRFTAPGDTPPRGVRLAVDVGTVRVGVAVSDPDGILATPVVTLARDTESAGDIDEIATLVAERSVVEVVVGLPRTLRGRDGTSAHLARQYAADLAPRIAPVPVVLVDARMTSVTANRILAERRVPGRSRRAVVDQIAAVEILQSRLDELRARRGDHG
jgi:putative Holliday junction resolvase